MRFWYVPVICILCLSGCYTPLSLSSDRAVSLWKTTSRTSSPATNVSAPVQLTLPEALRRAMKYHAGIREMMRTVQIRQAEIKEAGQLPNPRLRLSEFRLDQFAEGEPELETAMRFRFLRPGTLTARLRAAQHGLNQAKADEATLRRSVTSQVTLTYQTIAAVDAHLEWVAKEAAIRKSHLEQLRARTRANAATEATVASAQVPYARALTEQRTLTARRNRLVAQLRGLIGGHPGETWTVTSHEKWTEIKQAKLPVRSWVLRALKRRPELKAAAARVGAAHAEVFLAKQERLPWFNFAQLSYDFRPNLDPLRFGLAISIDIPIFSQNRGSIAVRQAQLMRRKTQERIQVEQIAREVHTAFTRLKGDIERLSLLESTLLPAARNALQQITRAVDAGTLDSLKKTKAEITLIRAERSRLDAKLAVQHSWTRLQAAVVN